MEINFDKYHGAGNDFILIDNRQSTFPADQPLIARICDRHFGIGADGLMLLEKSREYAFRMKYFNADGGEGTMCGNGGRCIIAFARKLGLIGEKSIFQAIDGIHEGRIMRFSERTSTVNLRMNAVLEVHRMGHNRFLMNTGSPHYVSFVENVVDIDIDITGKKIRFDKSVSRDGVNVNFVVNRGDRLSMRTYERGVEAETLSCGTGAVAAAIANAERQNYSDGNHTTEINAMGGNLKVHFKYENREYHHIWLEGPAEFVFTGSYPLL